MVEAVTVVSGNITASSSSSAYGYGSGIGSGYGYYGNSTVVNLTIVSGNITANSSLSFYGYGSGIGSGSATSGGASTVEALSVLGGTIRGHGAVAGIGSAGGGGETRLLAFRGTAALICNANAGKFPINASSIVLSDASLIFGTESDRLFGVSPLLAGWLNLTIVYGSATSAGTERLSGLNASILQIGNLSFNPPIGLYVSAGCPCTFCVSRAGDGDCIVTHSTEVSEVKSAVFSLPSDGSYSIRALLAGWTGVFETLKGVSSFNLSSNFSFVEEARLAWLFPFPLKCSAIKIGY
jgi:hypothetical protein